MDQEYEEDLLYRRLCHVKTVLEEGKEDKKDVVEKVCSLLEEILGEGWWEVAGRISRSKTMLGTGYRVRYDLVMNNTDIQTVRVKGKKAGLYECICVCRKVTAAAHTRAGCDG